MNDQNENKSESSENFVKMDKEGLKNDVWRQIKISSTILSLYLWFQFETSRKIRMRKTVLHPQCRKRGTKTRGRRLKKYRIWKNYRILENKFSHITTWFHFYSLNTTSGFALHRICDRSPKNKVITKLSSSLQPSSFIWESLPCRDGTASKRKIFILILLWPFEKVDTPDFF